MDVSALLLSLRDERDRLDNAISALEALRVKSKRGPGRRTAYSTLRTGRRQMSPASRKRLSAMMKQSWAQRKKKANKQTRVL